MRILNQSIMFNNANASMGGMFSSAAGKAIAVTEEGIARASTLMQDADPHLQVLLHLK